MNRDEHVVVSVSWGNDSIALVQFLHERGKYRKGQGAMTIDDEPAGHCGDLGFCGG